jgi:hypothetical protein
MDILVIKLVLIGIAFLIFLGLYEMAIADKMEAKRFRDNLRQAISRNQQLRSDKNPDIRKIRKSSREVVKMIKEFYGQS